MKRLFRRPDPGLRDYAALALIALAYAATLAFVLAPGKFVAVAAVTAQLSAN
jgi:hypothetical protein